MSFKEVCLGVPKCVAVECASKIVGVDEAGSSPKSSDVEVVLL